MIRPGSCAAVSKGDAASSWRYWHLVSTPANHLRILYGIFSKEVLVKLLHIATGLENVREGEDSRAGNMVGGGWMRGREGKEGLLLLLLHSVIKLRMYTATIWKDMLHHAPCTLAFHFVHKLLQVLCMIRCMLSIGTCLCCDAVQQRLEPLFFSWL